MKRTLLISGSVVIVLVVLAAVASLLGVQLFGGPDEAAADAPPRKAVKVLEMVRDEGNGPMSLRITVEPASELPSRVPEAGGVFIEQMGNLISVGTGNIELDVEVKILQGQEPERTVHLSHDGPTQQVLINAETLIYQDITDLDMRPSKELQGEITIQQDVKQVDSLTGLDQNSELQVWGRRQGTQIVAEVLVYHQTE